MHQGITHVGMWACTWIAFWNGAKMNGGPEDDFLTVLFWILCGFTMWFISSPQEASRRQGSKPRM